MSKTFEERFTEIYPRILALAGRFSRTTGIPAEEYESYLSEQFINVDASFNPAINNSYAAYVGAMLENKAKTMASTESKMRQFYDTIQRIDLPEDADEDAKYPQEFVAGVDIEEQVFDVMFVEEQLAKADGTTRKILRMFFDDPGISNREIAREVGVSNHTVRKRLEAVALAVRDA